MDLILILQKIGSRAMTTLDDFTILKNSLSPLKVCLFLINVAFFHSWTTFKLLLCSRPFSFPDLKGMLEQIIVGWIN